MLLSQILSESMVGFSGYFYASVVSTGLLWVGHCTFDQAVIELRSMPSQAAFKRQLKTFLFCDAFNIVYDEPWLFYCFVCM